MFRPALPKGWLGSLGTTTLETTNDWSGVRWSEGSITGPVTLGRIVVWDETWNCAGTVQLRLTGWPLHMLLMAPRRHPPITASITGGTLAAQRWPFPTGSSYTRLVTLLNG